MSRPTRIPIFPLELVLFPGTLLPLHIFEPRYRRMVHNCLEHRGEFGLVLAREKGITTVGCTAEIVEVTKRYDDGRMDILNVGRVAFRILQVFKDDPLLEAEVDYLPSDSEAPATPESVKLVELFEECHQFVFGKPAPQRDPARGGSLSFFVASELPLDLEFKQELLETESEAARIEALTERIAIWIPQLRHLNRARQLAGGNGHPLK
jgi:Uncharacterized protein, similar to the N-terminal domain of Lon protease